MTSVNTKTARKAMIAAGLVLFVLSFILPAMHTKVWESYQQLTGYECLFWGTIMGIIALIEFNIPLAFICLFSNVLMGASLLVLLTRKGSLTFSVLMLTEAALIFAAAVLPDAFGLSGAKFLPGYFAWCASFALIGTALALTSKTAGQIAVKRKNTFKQVAFS